MEKKCCICKNNLESENAAILTISGYAVPKYICSDCETDFDSATADTDTALIYAAMDRIGKKLLASGTDDELVLSEVSRIMSEADSRAKAIDEGTYDFTQENAEEAEEKEGAEPYEPDAFLEESAEDVERAKKEEQRAKKIDKITNGVCLAIIAAALGFFTYWILKRFL